MKKLITLNSGKKVIEKFVMAKELFREIANNPYLLLAACIGLIYNIATFKNPNKNLIIATIGLIPVTIAYIAYIFGIIEEE